jgi:hypothetical protein
MKTAEAVATAWGSSSGAVRACADQVAGEGAVMFVRENSPAVVSETCRSLTTNKVIRSERGWHGGDPRI